LTEDHTLLNAFIQAGRWDPDSTKPFPHQNVITRAVGTADDLEVDTRVDIPEPGDVYLICSDGLHGVLDDQQLAAVLLKHHDLTLAVARLIELTNDRGGPDNITAVLVRVG
jgi:protein phosphatase